MSIRQGGFMCTNTVTRTSSSGAGLAVVALAAMGVTFAATVGALVGGAIAAGILVLSIAAAGCLILTTVTRQVLHVLAYRRTGQLPAPRPIITINRPMFDDGPPVHRPRMVVTRADYGPPS